MTAESFAGGTYDFKKCLINEGEIVAFKEGTKEKSFFIRYKDGSEDLLHTPFNMIIRVGHHMRYIMHEDVGWVAYHIHETRTHYIDRERLERTIIDKFYPTNGQNRAMRRYGLGILILLVALAFSFSELISSALGVVGIAIGMWGFISHWIGMPNRRKVRKKFFEALYEQYEHELLHSKLR